MKIVKLLHNPTAGDEDHDKEELVKLIESKGYTCNYASTKKKNWKDIEPETDFIVVAGGDGTIRKVAIELLNRKLIDVKHPLAVLPIGTANNIGKTLKLHELSKEKIVSGWEEGHLKKFDVGKIDGMEDHQCFIESIGMGVFPNLINGMKKRDEEEDTPDEEIHAALEMLYDIIKEYKPRECKLEIDGMNHSGKFILVEIMNTKSIGPNLYLNNDSDPGDGMLEVVLIREDKREQFLEYIKAKIDGNDPEADFPAIKAKNVSLTWDGEHIHVDDKLVKVERPFEVTVEIKEGVLDFLVAE